MKSVVAGHRIIAIQLVVGSMHKLGNCSRFL
jgi:hypothetical protein